MSHPSYHLSLRRKFRDKTLRLATTLAMCTAVLPLLLIFYYVASIGIRGLSWQFFTELPTPIGGPTSGGMANAIVGSCVLVGFASVLATPLGILCGIFLSEYRTDRFSSHLRLTLDLLSSTPSIVVGLFAYSIIVVPLKNFSALAGAAALAFLMLPVVARTTEEILKLNGREIKEAGLALGLKRWKVTLFILVKGSLPAIFTGILLALARCAGETAPLLFTAFNNQYWSKSLFEPTASLPVQIYNYAISPFKDLQERAWTGALVLLVSVFLTNMIARSFLYLRSSGVKRR